MSPAPAPNPLLGTAYHTVGAASAALCYAPQRYLHRWSWQTYWLFQASMCWLVLPYVFAWIFIPHLGAVLATAPKTAMWHSYLLGVCYGVGGIAFNVAIIYIGYSLTYAVAIGVSCVLGTLLPPLMEGRLGMALASSGGSFVVIGVLLGGGAMVVAGLAGFRKERELDKKGGVRAFNIRIGLPIVLLAGVLSAVYNFSLQAAQPIADIAAKMGAGQFEGIVNQLFANPGAFTTTLIYAGWIATRKRSWGEFVHTSDARGLLRNYGLAFLTGLLWYTQFFFYNIAHVRMGEFMFSSWAIHMIILILLSFGFGLVIGEWKGCRRSTQLVVSFGIALLVAAVGLITYGNFLGNPPVHGV